MSWHNIKNGENYQKWKQCHCKKSGIKEFLNALSKYSSGRKAKNARKKLLRMGLEKVAKIENISKNELNQAEKLQKKSIDQLKGIDILRRIRNIGNLTKEDLIIALLKSVNSTAEHNFEKLFDNNTVDDDTNDGKIRGKISVIRMILSRLGNTVANNDRNKINKKLYETEKKKTPFK